MTATAWPARPTQTRMRAVRRAVTRSRASARARPLAACSQSVGTGGAAPARRAHRTICRVCRAGHASVDRQTEKLSADAPVGSGLYRGNLTGRPKWENCPKQMDCIEGGMLSPSPSLCSLSLLSHLSSLISHLPPSLWAPTHARKHRHHTPTHTLAVHPAECPACLVLLTLR